MSKLNLTRRVLWIFAAVLLLAPLIAMQFTDEVSWTGFDFAVATLLLGAVCGSVEIATRTLSSVGAAGLVIATASALAVVWVNLAVGIVGSEGEPLNLLFFAAIAFGLFTAALARIGLFSFAHALIATAAALGTAAALAFALAQDLGAIFAAIMSLPFFVSARLIAREEPSS